MTYTQYARLNQEQLNRLHELEQRLGSWVVAVEPQAEVARLSEEELRQLSELEDELNVVLVAYRPSGNA
jgi:hypothetical protein